MSKEANKIARQNQKALQKIISDLDTLKDSLELIDFPDGSEQYEASANADGCIQEALDFLCSICECPGCGALHGRRKR